MQENAKLRAENKDLRKQLGILDYSKEFNVIDSTINKHSSVEKKINLFMSLFIGIDVVGIYPMGKDETCQFLAVDFDDKDFEQASLAFKNTCIKNNIPAYVERSRSGCGTHIWIFFSDPMAMPIAWKGKVAQYAGRLHRNYEGKNKVQILDYVDIRVPVLERMYQKRLKIYASIGYQTKSIENALDSPSIIYYGKNFLPVYYNDINTASSEIVIVSPFMRKNRITQFIKILSPVVAKNISVTVITRPPEDFKDTEHSSIVGNITALKNAGIDVKLKSEFHQKFTIIDNATIWYGSANFLSFGSHEESIMRFESTDIPTELLESL